VLNKILAAMTLGRFDQKHSRLHQVRGRVEGARAKQILEDLGGQEQSWTKLQAAWKANEGKVELDGLATTKATMVRGDDAAKCHNPSVDEKHLSTHYIIVVAASSNGDGISAS